MDFLQKHKSRLWFYPIFFTATVLIMSMALTISCTEKSSPENESEYENNNINNNKSTVDIKSMNQQPQSSDATDSQMPADEYRGFATITKAQNNDDVTIISKAGFINISDYRVSPDKINDNDSSNVKTQPLGQQSQKLQLLFNTKLIEEIYPGENNNSSTDQLKKHLHKNYRIWVDAQQTATALFVVNDFEIIPYNSARQIPAVTKVLEDHNNNNNNNNSNNNELSSASTPLQIKFDEVAAWADRMPVTGGGAAGGAGNSNGGRRHLMLNFFVSNPDKQNKYLLHLDRVFISLDKENYEGVLPLNKITFVDENTNLPTDDTTQTIINPSAENFSISLRGLNSYPAAPQTDNTVKPKLYVTVIFSASKVKVIEDNNEIAPVISQKIILRQQGEIMFVW